MSRRGCIAAQTLVSRFDADLRAVICAWVTLPEVIKRAAVSLVRSHK